MPSPGGQQESSSLVNNTQNAKTITSPDVVQKQRGGVDGIDDNLACNFTIDISVTNTNKDQIQHQKEAEFESHQ